MEQLHQIQMLQGHMKVGKTPNLVNQSTPLQEIETLNHINKVVEPILEWG